jgi:hypothetical protein
MSESIALDYTAYEPKDAHFLPGAHHNDDYAIGDQALRTSPSPFFRSTIQEPPGSPVI